MKRTYLPAIILLSAIASIVFTSCPVVPEIPTPTPTPILAAPQALPLAGTYDTAQSVRLSCATSGAAIWYTVDGNTPVVGSSAQYSSPISVAESQTIKAIATKDGYTTSKALEVAYVINIPGKVTFSAAAGNYGNSFDLSLSSSNTGASIRYTTDNSDPSSTYGTLYAGSFSISKSCTVKAIAYGGDITVPVVISRAYTIVVASPSADVAAGSYSTEQSVSLSCATTDAIIYYTIDGSTPSASSAAYAGAITIDRGRTLKAIACRVGATNSAVSSFAYSFYLSNVSVNVGSGNYVSDQAVSITCPAGASIRYTLDGYNPSATSGTPYTGPVAIDTFKMTLKAIAYRTGWTNSAVATYDYKIAEASKRNFNAQRITDNVWYNCPATLLANSAHALVYCENAASVSAAEAAAMASEFESKIYSSVRSNFGNEPDYDANGKVILLLLDIKDGYSGSGGYVSGYFDPTHEFSSSDYTMSNEADMLFIDVYPSVVGSADSFCTIAHEFQHMVNFKNTYMADGREQEVWINEGLSSGAEYIYSGAQLADRIDFYNADPYGTIRNGNTFFVWDGFWEDPDEGNDTLANYSSVYVFFQWLQLHASNGTAIYKEILSSAYRNYRAVTDAAVSRIDASLSSWDTLLKTWFLANHFSDATGLYGYMGAFTLTKWDMDNTGGQSYYLSPGEGFFIKTSGGTFTPTAGYGPSIAYLGITDATKVLDSSSPYSGNIMLIFNNNISPTSADQKAYLPNVSSLGYSVLASMDVKIPRYVAPSSWRSDVRLKVGGGYASGSKPPMKSQGKAKGFDLKAKASWQRP